MICTLRVKMISNHEVKYSIYMEIELKPIVGSFAENKDIAKDILYG